MLKITPIPAFSDNYIWIIANTDNSEAFLVDPGDGKVALNALDAANLTIAGVLVTHHHPDHVGGLDLILSRFFSVAFIMNSSSAGVGITCSIVKKISSFIE